MNCYGSICEHILAISFKTSCIKWCCEGSKLWSTVFQLALSHISGVWCMGCHTL